LLFSLREAKAREAIFSPKGTEAKTKEPRGKNFPLRELPCPEGEGSPSLKGREGQEKQEPKGTGRDST
jgi:hypothetical protein